MQTKAYRLAVLGAYGNGNFGDDLLARCLTRKLVEAFSATELCIVGTPRPYLREWLPGVSVISPQPPERVHVGTLIYGGGTQFASFENTRERLSQRLMALVTTQEGRRRLLRKAAHAARGAALVHDRAAATGIGVGPFVANSSEERRAREVLARCTWISVRDTSSQSTLRAWGLDAHLHPDPVYCQDLWMPAGTSIPTARGGAGIAVIPRDWPHAEEGAAHFSALLGATDRLRADGHAVSFILFSPSSDQRIGAELASRGESVLLWDPSADGLETLVTKLAQFDVLITARAHGVILGAILGIPPVAVLIEPKLRAIAEGLGSAVGYWAPPFAVDELRRLVDERLNAAYAITHELLRHSRELASGARAGLAALLGSLQQ